MNPERDARPARLADLERGEVHLHHFQLDGGRNPPLALQTDTLNAHERRRSTGFLRALDRERFVTARWSLRTVLGTYLDLAPSAVPLTVTPSGKPVLAPPHAALQFNLSHSGGRALLAAALGRPVGVDLETVLPLPEVLGVAARVCTARELAELHAAPEPFRTAMFYRLWTRREAALKALGTGLGGPPEQVEVSGGPARSMWLQTLGGSPDLAARALSTDPDVPSGFQASLVVGGGAGLRLRAFAFTGTGFTSTAPWPDEDTGETC